MQKDIKGQTRYTFTFAPTGQVVTGLFMFEDEDGIFIRTDDCDASIEGANFGVHLAGVCEDMWSYTLS